MKVHALIRISIAACITCLIGPTFAAMEGVLQDSDKTEVIDGFGECVSIDKQKHFHDKGDGPCGMETKKAAKPAPPPPKPAPKPIVRESVTLGAHALFNHDRSNLRPEGKRELEGLVTKLQSYTSVRNIDVVGHTDSDGSNEYNQGLSERRAASVRAYLVELGIDSSLITTSGKGETAPVASNATNEGRAQNRRVEIHIDAIK